MQQQQQQQQQRELSDDADAHGEEVSRSSSPWPLRWSTTLAVENATILPDWIDVLSRELFVGNDGNNNDDDGDVGTSMLSVLLKQNKMGLEILPPSSLIDNDDDDGNDPKQLAAKLWSTSQKIAEAAATPDQLNLVLYIPSHLLPTTENEDRYIEWKSLRTTKAKGASTTVLVPSLRSSSESTTAAATTTTAAGTAATNSAKPSNLKSLVEDWMARSMIIEQQQQLAQGQQCPTPSYSDSDSVQQPQRKRRRRLTPEYPVDRFMAVLMPLIFPLVIPFTITWIKEAKRYKRLKRKQ